MTILTHGWDEGVQPRSTKQCKTKATPQTARAKASQNNQGLSPSSPIRKHRGLRVPAAIDFMDVDGFDTSLLSDSSVPTRSQNPASGSSAGKVRSTGSNTTTTKKAALLLTCSTVAMTMSRQKRKVPIHHHRTVKIQPFIGTCRLSESS